MQNDYTHITIVLDRSGSMASVQDDTIGGFNTFLAEQQSQPGHATLTLVQFDDQYEVWNDFAPIGDVPALTHKTFVPRGSTALLDAMGRAIDETGKRLAEMPDSSRPGKILVVTLTDGAENASQNFNYSQIQTKITHQRKSTAGSSFSLEQIRTLLRQERTSVFRPAMPLRMLRPVRVSGILWASYLKTSAANVLKRKRVPCLLVPRLHLLRKASSSHRKTEKHFLT